MRIFIDIGHPAHVHYFRNFIKFMSDKGHEFFVTARQKEVSHILLEKYEIDFFDRGMGGDSTIGKLFYLPKADWLLYKCAKKFKPDMFLSFASPYAAHVSYFLGKPHIAFDDTENARFGQIMYRPFTKYIYSPESYKGKRSPKQSFFNGYMELSYLHPNYFNPNKEVLNYLELKDGQEFVIVRFVSWNATHDSGHSGISLDNKRKIIDNFSKYAKVFISSEGSLPEDLQKYKISIPPDMMHDALYFATLFFGESATMASESAVLGTQAIYLDNEGRGYTDDLEKSYGLVYNFTEDVEDQKKAIEKGEELLKNPSLKKESALKRAKLLSEKIDVTEYIINTVTEIGQSKN